MMKNQIINTHHNDFQNFVEQLFLIKYGDQFTPIKQKRDLGCDGIINHTRTILAVYGPEKRDLNQFKNKIEKDFEKYQENWAADYPGWMVIYNNDFTASEKIFLTSLKTDCVDVGLKNILSYISEFPWRERRNIADLLGIHDRFFHNDILAEIVEDLIPKTEITQNLISYSKPTYIEEKIEINYLPEEVEAAKTEFQNIMRLFGALKNVLSSYKDIEHMALQSKIVKDLNKYSGTFSERLENLAEIYSQSNPYDDIYSFHVKVVLIYYFERCLIGIKSRAER